MEKVRWIPVASPRGWNRFEIAGVLAAFVLFSCTVAMGQKPEYAGIRVPAVAGSARITPSPSASSEKASVVLPLEVLGPDGTTVTARFNIPDGPDLNKRLKLWLEIHALKYETEASLQINGGEWIPINSNTVSIQGLGATYGGIGGGFSTLKMTLNLRVDAVHAGANTLTFRFNGTDGIRSGFRVLNFNIVASNGEYLIPAATFTEDDPSRWQPPLSSPADIQAGKTLWNTAALTAPGFGAMRAKCGSCHAQDGRDLKYFNYSNLSIRARSMFHGLTARQGDQIASYIRTLDVPAPAMARPWNPPYQPGPGLDARPVAEWAAGAGLGAVLDHDADMQPYLLPDGSSAGWAAGRYLNARELPIALQLPDWNSWLPQIHPLDAFGENFAASGIDSSYQKVRGELHPQNAAAYHAALGDIGNWLNASGQFLNSQTTRNWDATNMRQKTYSGVLWLDVKFWELNQEFGLEGMPQAVYGSKADARGWSGNLPFFTSPVMQHIPPGVGLGNGSVISYEYLAFIWYHMQLLLNDGQGSQTDHNPIDFPYVFGVLKDLSLRTNNSSQAMLLLEWMVKGLQEMTQPGKGPEFGVFGWAPAYAGPVGLVHPGWSSVWQATPPQTRADLSQKYLRVWLQQVSSFSPQQFYQGKWASAAEDPSTEDSIVSFGGRVWYMLPRFRYIGVDPNLTYQISAWAATMWPRADWALNNAAACANINSCTSDR